MNRDRATGFRDLRPRTGVLIPRVAEPGSALPSAEERPMPLGVASVILTGTVAAARRPYGRKVS